MNISQIAKKLEKLECLGKERLDYRNFTCG